MQRPRISRRQLLVRSGTLGAAVALAPGLLRPRPAGALLRGLLGGGTDTNLLDAARRLLTEVSIDTYRGLVAFVAPGNDAHSLHQGASTNRPGALAAQADRFLSEALDRFLPLPDSVLRSTVRTLAGSLDDAGIPLDDLLEDLLGGLLPGLGDALDDLGDAVDRLLANDETLPLSALVAMLLNVEATTVDPTSVVGELATPFSNLAFANKAAVFASLEDPRPDLVALIDRSFPEPLQESVSGILRFTAGALLGFSAFATFCEYPTFDPATRTVTARPVGWDLSSYLPGMVTPPEGWDDLLGYYEDRRSVS